MKIKDTEQSSQERLVRQEHKEATLETKTTLTRLEINIKELVEKTAGLEPRPTVLVERVSDSEHRTAKLERAIAFFLSRPNSQPM